MTFVRSRQLFLRLLGLVYLIAFVSLAVQIVGLVGAHGLLPVEWPHSDLLLAALSWGGAAVALLLMAGIAPAASAALLWALYLTLTIAGQVFLEFQWDALLLETGLLAILYAPFTWRSRVAMDPEPPALVRWVLWFLAFKLTFLSGITKILSGDRTWANWTALTYHYETQPIPAWTSWYAHQLPASVHYWSTAGMFVIELLVPWLVFLPPRFRRVRAAAAALMASLQAGIAATGNYGFFNLLTIVLYLALLDDGMLALPQRPRAPELRLGPTNAGARLATVRERRCDGHRVLQRDDGLSRDRRDLGSAERVQPAVVAVGVGHRRAARLDQWVRVVPRHDDRPPGDCDRGER